MCCKNWKLAVVWKLAVAQPQRDGARGCGWAERHGYALVDTVDLIIWSAVELAVTLISIGIPWIKSGGFRWRIYQAQHGILMNRPMFTCKPWPNLTRPSEPKMTVPPSCLFLAIFTATRKCWLVRTLWQN